MHEGHFFVLATAFVAALYCWYSKKMIDKGDK